MAPLSAPMGSTSPDVSHSHPQVLQTGDLIASLPAPVLRLLVLFARPISYFKRALEVLSWRSGKRVESWLVVALWWALCLGANYAFIYLLPPLVFLPLVPLSTLRLKSVSSTRSSNTPSAPSTSETLLLTLSDLNAIYALLPPSPTATLTTIYSRFRQLGGIRLLRGLVVIWITWFILGKIIGFRTLLAILGTAILLLPSPPLAHLVNLLSKSLFVRRGLALAFLFTFGSPPEVSYQYRFSLSFSPLGWVKSKWSASRRPSLALSFRPKMATNAPLNGSALADEDENEKQENPIYFRFEIHENQRWWMGLDWTSALLPQERPSWCDLHLQPVSPPPSFSLPSSVSIVVPSPTPKNPSAKVLRTATWKWLDDDWSIVRAGSGLAANPTAPPTVPAPIPATSGANGEGDSESGSGVSLSHPMGSRTSSISLGTSPPKGVVGGGGGGGGIEEPPPSAGVRAQSIAEQAFTKGLERLKARTNAVTSSATSAAMSSSGTNSTPIRKSFDGIKPNPRPRTGSSTSDEYIEELTNSSISTNAGAQVAVPTETIVERDDATDMDGWVYGDNKWENMGAKGGLGKFTRRRRWTRRAVCIEIVTRISSTDEHESEEMVEEGMSGNATPKGKGKGGGPSSPLKAAPVRAISDINATPRTTSIDSDRTSSITSTSTGLGSGKERGDEGVLIDTNKRGDDVLRMRLKKAMGSMGG